MAVHFAKPKQNAKKFRLQSNRVATRMGGSRLGRKIEYRLVQGEGPKFTKSRKFTPFFGDRSGVFAHVFNEPLSTH